MEVSLNELRDLRQILTMHRLEHERMVAKMQLLRKKSRQTRLNAIRSQLEMGDRAGMNQQAG